MTSRAENLDTPRIRDGRRRELRELLVTAATAARKTRESAAAAARGNSSRRAIRERMTVFFAAAR
jgi:hypothetical protein